MRSTPPLDRFSLIKTSSLDETRAALGHAYAKPELNLVGRNKELRAIVNGCELPHIALNYGAYSAMLRMEFPETDFASQIFTTKGSNETLVNGTPVDIGPDCGVVISPGATLRITNCDDCERMVLKVSTAALMSKLAAIAGDVPGGPIEFHPVQNYAQPTAKALRDHFLFLVHQLSTRAAPLPKLVLTEFEQMLIVMFLKANRHNYSHLLEQPSPDTALWQLRCAEEYLEASPDRPMTLETLTDITGASALSLLRSFKRFRGFSLMEFANKVRLNHAYKLLRHPDAGATVAAVAAACGFADIGRFARDYQRTFGEQPGQTVSRGRGPGPNSH